MSEEARVGKRPVVAYNGGGTARQVKQAKALERKILGLELKIGALVPKHAKAFVWNDRPETAKARRAYEAEKSTYTRQVEGLKRELAILELSGFRLIEEFGVEKGAQVKAAIDHPRGPDLPRRSREPESAGERLIQDVEHGHFGGRGGEAFNAVIKYREARRLMPLGPLVTTKG